MSLFETARNNSDHHDHVTELEPAILESLKNTPESCPTLEIGVQNGGSLLYTLYLMTEVLKQKREMVSIDANPAPKIHDWMDKAGVKWTHHQMAQIDFVKEHGRRDWGFVYFDAEKSQELVLADIGTMLPSLPKGCVVAFDDANLWNTIPMVEGLEEVRYGTDQWGQKGSHGLHLLTWRKK